MPLQIQAREDFKVAIPRSLVELMELEPQRFGFSSPDLQERFQAGISQRKLAVMRRQPGGLTASPRGPYTIFTNGKYSRYGAAAQALNSDPADYRKGPVLRPRDLAEAKEIYEVLYRGLTYFRLRGDQKKTTYYNVVISRFRGRCLIPMWAEVAGVFLYTGDAYMDAMEQTRRDVDVWMDEVRRSSKTLVSEFEQDFAGLPYKTIEARATAYLMVPRVLVGLAWLWADDPIRALEVAGGGGGGDQTPATVWDRILVADHHIRKGVTIPMQIGELEEFSFRLNQLFDHVLLFENDTVSASDWEGLLKANNSAGLRMQSFESTVGHMELDM